MASWEVKFRDGDTTTTVDLIDSLGPINEWKAHDANALLPNKGGFTNQTKKVVPDVQPTWILKDFDIDGVEIGDTGAGDMLDNDGSFPSGSFNWEVTKSI